LVAALLPAVVVAVLLAGCCHASDCVTTLCFQILEDIMFP
jgi:hypothetical protein